MAETALAQVSQQLLDDIKGYLDITWSDSATDKKVAEIAASGVRYLDGKAGENLDYTVPGDGRSLLFEYARYARDGALDVFENNYRHLLLDMQHARQLARREGDAV